MTTATDAPTFPQHVRGTFQLTSSLIHGGDETLGTTKLFRSKGWIHEGRRIRIPILSGNAIRGMWRRACAQAFLDEYLAAGGEPLSLSAFYYLTSGGSLSKGSSVGTSIDLVGEADLRKAIPHVGLFGGAGLGRIQAGKLYVDEAVPICLETVPILQRMWPEVRDAETADLSIRELTEVHGYSRQDDAKNMHWHRYLSPAARSDATAVLERVEADELAAPAGAPQQMRYEQVELVAGTVLFHRWGFRWPATRTELAGLAAGLLRWEQRPHAGGRNAIGHGNLVTSYEGVRTETKLLGDGTAPLTAFEDEGPEEVVRSHVREHLDEIRSVLGAL